jgi:DNA polymerase-3 subunit delta'
MIYGNASVVELIDRAANGGRLCHAYLFYGEKGLGKKAIAAYFAKAILCRGGKRPCGECPSCKKMETGAHPDLTILSGTAEKNELTVANVRKLKADAAVYPNDGDKKVYLISDCQKMQAPAANALLKLLEEPPEHLVILLTADDRGHVLPTILSRCIPVGVFPVGEDECARALEVLGGVSPEVSRKAAAACGGNIGKGLALLAPESLPVSPDDFCLMLSKHQEYGMLAALNKLSSDKQVYRAFLEALFERFRDAAVLKSGGKRLIAGSKDAAAALIGSFTTKQLLEKIRILSRAMKDLDANANVPVLSAWITSSLVGAPVKN